MKAQVDQVLTGIRCRQCVLASHVARRELLNAVTDERYPDPPVYPISSRCFYPDGPVGPALDPRWPTAVQHALRFAWGRYTLSLTQYHTHTRLLLFHPSQDPDVEAYLAGQLKGECTL